jgi:phage/plasmid-associated DNA primase
MTSNNFEKVRGQPSDKDERQKKRIEMVDAVRSFKSFYGTNPFRFGKQIAYTPQGKVSETITAPLTDEDIEQHLILGHTLATFAYGIGRIGLISSDGLGKKGIIGSIDVDRHNAESSQVFDAVCDSIDDFCRANYIVVYKELTLGKGYHYNFPIDEPTALEDIVNFLYYITSSVNQPQLETYPMGKDPANSRWMYVGNGGALSDAFDEDGLILIKDKTEETLYKYGYGRTFQTTLDGKSLSIFELETVEKNLKAKVIHFAEKGKFIKQRAIDFAKNNISADNPMAADIANNSFNLSEVIRCITTTVPHTENGYPNIKFLRHDSLFCWLNIGRRMNALEKVSEVLKDQATYEAWITDGSRTINSWESEIDRICEKFVYYGTEEYGHEYGIKRLLNMGWKVPDLAKLAPADVVKNASNLAASSSKPKEKFGKQSDRTLARRIIEEHKANGQTLFYRSKRKAIYQFNGEYYRIVREYQLRNVIAKWMDSVFGEGIAGSVRIIRIIEEIKILLSDGRADIEPENTVNTSGGILKFVKQQKDYSRHAQYKIEILPHTDEFLSFGKIHAKYVEAYADIREWDDCRFIKALRTSFYTLSQEQATNSIRTIMEFIGYSFTGFMNAQKALNLHGQAGTGKGMIMETIQKLSVGIKEDIDGRNEEEVIFDDSIFSSMLFNQFSSSHGLTQVEDRRVVYVSEVDSSNAARQSMINIKAIVGGDKISINPKMVDSYTYQPLCKLIIASNTELPFGSDRSNDSITRRLVRVIFPSRLREQDKNNSIREYVTETQEQLDRIFSIAIRCGLDFINNNWQNTAYDHAKAVYDAKEEMNPVIEFLNLYVVPSKSYEKENKGIPLSTRVRAYIKVSILHKMYNLWAMSVMLRPLPPKAFMASLVDATTSLNWDTEERVGIIASKRNYKYLTNVYVRSESDIKDFAEKEYEEIQEQFKQSLTIAKLDSY